MPLVAVTAGQQAGHAQLDQLIDLLTGVMTDQVVTLRLAAGSPLVLDRSDAAGIKGLLAGQRVAGTKWFLGLDASDQFAVLNAAGTLVNLGITDLGAGTFRAGLTAGGMVTAPGLNATGKSGLNNIRATEYIGAWSTVGKPTGLPSLTGDWGFDGNDNRWVCISSGTPGTWVPSGLHRLQQVITSASQASVLFSSIPGDYSALEIIYWGGRSTTVGTGDAYMIARYNGDSAANHYFDSLFGNYGTSTNFQQSEDIGTAYSGARVGVLINGSSLAALASRGEILIPGYADTTAYKVALWRNSSRYDSVSVSIQHYQGASTWNSTAAMTQIELFPTNPDFAAGGTFVLYGRP